MTDDLRAPWAINFERDGTEDVAVIRDADDSALVTSRGFWLPEGDEPAPPTLAAVRLMTAAPLLSRALAALLNELDAVGHAGGLPEGAVAGARDALAAALGHGVIR
jgi:hypothetical protein